jgi:hypothetical protein
LHTPGKPRISGDLPLFEQAQLANEAGPVTYSSKRLGEESAFYGLSLSSFREQMDVVELAKDVMICYSRADLSFLKVLSGERLHFPGSFVIQDEKIACKGRSSGLSTQAWGKSFS